MVRALMESGNEIGLKEFRGCQDLKRGESEFAASKMADIVGNDGIRGAGHCQFDKMVAGFIRKIRAPQEVNLDPLAGGKNRRQQPLSFVRRKRARGKRFKPAEKVFILVKKRCSNERLCLLPETSPQHLANSGPLPRERWYR